MDIEDNRLNIYLEEYKTLKAEQSRRIAVRDHVIYLTIAAVGLIFGLKDKLGDDLSLLIVPWIGLLLGWTYLMNDQKISAIGTYVRRILDDRLKKILATQEDLFGWESEHRSDELRIQRKLLQLLVNLLAFVVPGIATTLTFIITASFAEPLSILAGLELLLLLILGWQIWKYADLKGNK
jgi:hypothetical protein